MDKVNFVMKKFYDVVIIVVVHFFGIPKIVVVVNLMM